MSFLYGSFSGRYTVLILGASSVMYNREVGFVQFVSASREDQKPFRAEAAARNVEALHTEEG